MKSKKRAKHAWFPGGALILLILLAFGSCNWGVPDYTLIVVVEEGVTGTPATGQYVHKELTAVDFSYTPINPLHTVEVIINGSTRQSTAGSLVLYAEKYTLTARLVDIRGTWKVEMTWLESITVDFKFTITISGEDLLSGTFIDSRGYNGTWSAESNVVTFTYSDWNDFILIGLTFYMQGTFTGDGSSGSWTAERQN